MKILVVEDSPQVAETIMDYLAPARGGLPPAGGKVCLP